jgi:hypothetical protein
MIEHVIGWILGSAPRSPKWPAVRKHFLEGKVCAACDQRTDLEAHHIQPFDQCPERELDPQNLICLCRQCHFFIGHLQDWRVSNPYVVMDSAWYRQRYLDARKSKS